MTPWTCDLNFCSAILDLRCWMMLIAAREKDHRLLLLSADWEFSSLEKPSASQPRPLPCAATPVHLLARERP